MRKVRRNLVFITLLILLSSCFELIEDTTLKADGSGNYKLTLNLSSSTTKINSIMAMDSINGKKVPSIEDLQKKLEEYVYLLDKKEGLSNLKASLNTENWILKLSLDFQSLDNLRNGIIDLSADISQKEADEKTKHIKLNYSDDIYQRKIGGLIPINWLEKVRENKDYSGLKEGKCVFIQRFDKEIKEVNNEEVLISKNRRSAMLKRSPLAILNAPEKIDYTIILNP